jgi:protein TonB
VQPDQQQLLGRYAQQLSRLLASQQEYPRLAAMRGWEGEVRLRLKVARKGNLLSLQVDRSSGHEILDQHALQLVDQVRLPPFPDELEGSEIQITVPVNYKLKKAV